MKKEESGGEGGLRSKKVKEKELRGGRRRS